MTAILYPKPLDFKFYQDSIKFILFLAVMASLGMTYSLIMYIRNNVRLTLPFLQNDNNIIITIPMKGAILDFYYLLTALQTVCNMYSQGCNGVQITCNTLSAYHVQHVACHLVRRDSSAIKFDSVNNCVYFSFFILLAEPLSSEGGEETGVPGENP